MRVGEMGKRGGEREKERAAKQASASPQTAPQPTHYCFALDVFPLMWSKMCRKELGITP